MGRVGRSQGGWAGVRDGDGGGRGGCIDATEAFAQLAQHLTHAPSAVLLTAVTLSTRSSLSVCDNQGSRERT